MKFLVDAQLPPRLCFLLRKAGHDASHTSDLPAQNRTPDGLISEISVAERSVVISKDTDFYHSHLLHGRPRKLVLVRTGNLRAQECIALFMSQLPAIVQSLETHTLVELDRTEVRVVS